MKVYVEKLPKECYCCVFNIEDVGGIGGYCIFGGGKKDCPLIPLADYTKQVRKEVCEKIKKQIFNHFNVKNMEEYENLSLIDSLFTADAVIEMLDTILKEYQK